MLSSISHRVWICGLASSAAFYGATLVGGDEPRLSRDDLKEPVFRVTKRIEPEDSEPAHPLDQAIQMARETLGRIQSEVQDYTCTIVKQERIDGEVGPTEHMRAEIRNGKTVNGVTTQPFSVYLSFLKPDAIQGREVLYVAGANNGKMVAQEAKGVASFLGEVWLAPDGAIAMRGQRYPLTDIGIENLLAKLVERGLRDRQNDPEGKHTTVKFIPGAKINGRPCTVLEVTHPEKKPCFDFHVARIFIDDETQLPIRYAAYSWPLQANGKPELEEAYTYLDVKLNVGLTDRDFDHNVKFKQRS